MILNLFKPKPTLKELITKGYLDIHSHVLAEIDDGAKNIKESLKLISEMKKMGFSKIIATPHTYPGLYDNTTESIKRSFEKLKKELPKNTNIDYASEYMLEKSIIEKARNNKLLCLKDNYVLIEMSFIFEQAGLYEIIYEIVVNGYRPILAHPERYLYYSNLKDFFKLKKCGCLFQANLLSSTDYYGIGVRKNLDRLLKNQLIDFSGSDIHNINQIEGFEKKVKCREIQELKNIIENNNQLL